MLRNLRHWMNAARRVGYNGPTAGAVLLDCGTVVEVPDLTDWRGSYDVLAEVCGEDVIATFVSGKDGAWSGQGLLTHKATGEAYWGWLQPQGSLAEAVADYTGRAAAEARAAELLTDAEVLYSLLTTHDWYGAMSDNPGAWRATQRGLQRIRSHVASMDRTEAAEIWASCAPEGFAFPV